MTVTEQVELMGKKNELLKKQNDLFKKEIADLKWENFCIKSEAEITLIRFDQYEAMTERVLKNKDKELARLTKLLNKGL